MSYPRSTMPLMSFSLKWLTPPLNLNVAIARRSWSASVAVNPAQTMATRIACS